jgi:5'-3' exonuclease
MILLDLNQVMISNIMTQLSPTQTKLEESLIRHMVLNNIRMYKQKHSAEYGEMVICCDDKNYWRKDIFPYYKAHRKVDREKSPLDWNLIFDCLNKIRDELKETFPYKVLQIPRAEADDIIGTLVKRYGVYLNNMTTEKILIISGDKDFGQLQKYVNVDQYSPITKKWIKINDAARFLKEHIMKGDRGDGIPNFLSPDSCIVMNERQKPLSAKKIEQWIDMNLPLMDTWTLGMVIGYQRNEQLVDLDKIPKSIADQVNDAYDNYNVPEKNGLLNYFIKHRLKLLTEHIGEF